MDNHQQNVVPTPRIGESMRRTPVNGDNVLGSHRPEAPGPRTEEPSADVITRALARLAGSARK